VFVVIHASHSVVQLGLCDSLSSFSFVNCHSIVACCDKQLI